MSTRAQTLDAATIPAPVGGWRRTFADWLVVGRATAVCHALGAATGLLLRVLLSPAQMGIWQAAKLLLSYGNYANLGISKAAVREYNVALGAGDTSAARQGLNLAFTVNTISSLLYAAVLLGAGLWIAGSAGGPWGGSWAVALVAVAGLAVVARYLTFHVTILRTQQAFAATARLSVLEATLTLPICGLAVWLWGLAGLYVGTLAVMLGSLVFVRRHATVRLRPAWGAAEVRKLLGIGGPILLAGAVSTLLRSLDRLMILGYLDDRELQLGCYSLALMVTVPLFGLGNMLSTVLGPRYGEKFGSSGDRGPVARLAARASEPSAAAMALPAGLAMVAAPPLLGRLLPDYHAGLAPIAWLVPAVVLLVLALPGSQYLVAVGRQRRALAVVLLATVVAAVGNHMALRGGYGLSGVAAATALAYTVYFLLVVAFSIWIELDRPARIRYLAMLALAAGPTMAAAVVLSWTRLQDNWTVLALKVAIVSVVWGLSATAAWRHGGWAAEVKPTKKPV